MLLAHTACVALELTRCVLLPEVYAAADPAEFICQFRHCSDEPAPAAAAAPLLVLLSRGRVRVIEQAAGFAPLVEGTSAPQVSCVGRQMSPVLGFTPVRVTVRMPEDGTLLGALAAVDVLATCGVVGGGGMMRRGRVGAGQGHGVRRGGGGGGGGAKVEAWVGAGRRRG